MENLQVVKKEVVKKPWLNEVSFMRPVLLILLVSYHAFAPYVGVWQMPDGIQEVNLYKVIALLSRAFRLEGFVFISGYIFTFQLVERKKFDTFGSLLNSKLQRLLIPSFLFSALYIVFFLDFEGLLPFAVKVVEGAGHLWYLPCLFWLFLIQYVIVKQGWTMTQMAIPLVLGVILSVLPLPLQLDKSLYYCMFFTGGGNFWMYSDKLSTFCTTRRVLISWVVFAISFCILNLAIRHFSIMANHSEAFMYKNMMLAFKSISKALLAWTGICALYLTSVKYCQKHKLSLVIIKIGACGYGVYVFHQFILVFLYRQTELPHYAGTYWLPWIGFVVTVFLSTVLTLAVRTTKIGKKYL